MNFKNLMFFFLTATTKKLQTPVHFNTPVRFSSSYTKELSNGNYNNNLNIYSMLSTRNITGIGVDVNCKIGDSTKILSMKYPELHIYGIDKNYHLIEIARKKHKTFDFLNVNFEFHTGIPTRSFNLIQISDYDDLLLSYQKAIILLEYGGMIIYHCKNQNDLILLQKYLVQHEKSLYTSSYHPNISHYVSGSTLFIFK